MFARSRKQGISQKLNRVTSVRFSFVTSIAMYAP